MNRAAVEAAVIAAFSILVLISAALAAVERRVTRWANATGDDDD